MRAALAPHSFIARNPPRHPSISIPVGLRTLRDIAEGPSGGETGDTFVFDDNRRDDDLDTIVDFRPGTDKIDLSRTLKFRGADFEELLAAAEQAGRDIVIDMGHGQGTLTFENVDLSELDEGDFIF